MGPGDLGPLFVPLTPEELEQAGELTRERLEEAFKKGRADMEKVRRKPKGRY